MAVNSIEHQEVGAEIGTTEIVKEIEKESPRYLSIDVFRGLAIVFMIFANIVAPFDNVPAWSKHALDYGFTYVDIGTPLFFVAIGLTYTMSFNKTVSKNGWFQAFLRFLRRYAALYGMGAIGAIYFFTKNGILFSWGVLQAIGLAGIFTLFFIKFNRWIRMSIGIGCLAVYQYVLTIPIKIRSDMVLFGNFQHILTVPIKTRILLGDLNLLDVHGGIIGGIGYCILLLLCTAIVDDYRKTKKWFILTCGGVFAIAGLILHIIWYYTGWPAFGGISKERVTVSYILLTVGLGAILFCLIWFIYDKKQLTRNRSILQPMGRNAILLYILHPIFILLTILILNVDSNVFLVMFLSVISVAILWSLAFFLDRKKFYVVI